MMKININTQPLVAQQLPSSYTVEIEGIEYTVENYPALTELHYEHGWRDLIIPEIDHNTEKLGELIYDEVNDVGTYEVIQKTEQEIQEEILQQVQSQQAEALQFIQQSKLLSEIQEYEDEDALQNQAAYPFWESGIYVELGQKYQYFNADNEMKLYKCIQAHTTQENWKPKDTPALWVEVAPDGVIPVWKQPLGQHDAYRIGDLVHFPTKNDPIYLCTHDYNVYAPDVFGWELND